MLCLYADSPDRSRDLRTRLSIRAGPCYSAGMSWEEEYQVLTSAVREAGAEALRLAAGFPDHLTAQLLGLPRSAR